jgi:hypothetical protein
MRATPPTNGETGTRAAGPACGRRGALAARGVNLVLLAVLVLGAGVTRLAPEEPSSPWMAVGGSGWVEAGYGPLVDRRQLTHSGESVGRLLDRLGGRPFPASPGDRPGDAATHRLLDPILEPHAFVLPDVLDALEAAPDPPLVEVGDLWRPGEAQPAWAEILRSRRYVVESDGEGRFRVCAPWTPPAGGTSTSAEKEVSAGAAAREAWEAAWPVLRHVLAAERRRLARRAGDRPESHPIDVVVHAYVHEPERTSFRLGLEPYRVHVESTASRSGRPPLDLTAWQRFLDRGLDLEGGLLEPAGTLRLLGTPVSPPPGLLGGPETLADFAVAYRAVFHGGRAESYMSLDRGEAPHVSNVNFGGRLRDTALGLVSLRSDIRFKTFSLGIDVTEGKDAREALRRALPSFRTHLERFASDPRTQGLMSQQTRLWFYPDDVNVSLSAEGDVLVMRRARMTAASERMQEATQAAVAAEEPPWTRETIAAINRDYDLLARALPELQDLDRVARLLTLFTWLRQTAAEGRVLPDLDALLDLTLPALPTPRRFPQLLAHNALPPAGERGEVDVIDRAPVVEALERLRPSGGSLLPAARRFRRAVAMLDRRLPDHAALAKELEGIDPSTLDDGALDVMAYRAERLVMHQLVLRTLPAADRERLQAREEASRSLRIFSVGIGGVDLGMGQALARAPRRDARLEWGGAPREAGARPEGEAVGGPPSTAATPSVEEEAADGPVLPDHGQDPGQKREYPLEKGASRILKAVFNSGGAPRRWFQVVMGADGPDARSRLVVLDLDGRARTIERVEDGRFLRYAIERDGTGLVARPIAAPPLPIAVVAPRPPVPPVGDLPASFATLEVVSGPGGARDEAPLVRVKIHAAGSKEVEAAFPRPVLQRVVLGREADLAAGRPLPGLGSPEQVLGSARRLMALMRPAEALPPWSGAGEAVPGEEDPVKVGTAVGRWWAAEPSAVASAPAVVLGTAGARSVERWAKAPAPVRGSVLLLPDGAFSGPYAAIEDRLAAAWGADRTARNLAPGKIPDLVVLASAEPPALLGARLRAIARDPAMKGKLLAVWPIGGPVRGDIPASLLDEGNLAGVGLSEWSPIALRRVVDEVGRLGKAASGPAKEARAEDLAPFLAWYF